MTNERAPFLLTFTFSLAGCVGVRRKATARPQTQRNWRVQGPARMRTTVCGPDRHVGARAAGARGSAPAGNLVSDFPRGEEEMRFQDNRQHVVNRGQRIRGC